MQTNSKLVRNFIISTFVSLYLLVSIISTIHVIEFFKLSNNEWLAITLAIAFEIGAAASLASLIALDKMNRGMVWILFFVLTAMQAMGNTYYAFVNLKDFNGWVELFGLMDEELIYQKRILSLVSGAVLPLIALGFIKSLVDYIKPDPIKSEEIVQTPENNNTNNSDDLFDDLIPLVNEQSNINTQSFEISDNIIIESTEISEEVNVESIEISEEVSIESIDESIEMSEEVNIESIEISEEVSIESIEMSEEVSIESIDESIEMSEEVNVESIDESIEISEEVSIEFIEMSEEVSIESLDESIEISIEISEEVNIESIYVDEKEIKYVEPDNDKKIVRQPVVIRPLIRNYEQKIEEVIPELPTEDVKEIKKSNDDIRNKLLDQVKVFKK